jgi:hypothetical protein
MLVAIYICAGQHLPATSAQIVVDIPGIPKFPKPKGTAGKCRRVPGPTGASGKPNNRHRGKYTTGPVKARQEDPTGTDI